jgi:hypothetical protein
MKRFSQQEKEWILNNFAHMSLDEMALFLNRTKSSVKALTHKLKLKKVFDYSRQKNINVENGYFCYLLGFIWADGCIRDGAISLSIVAEDAQKLISIFNEIQGFRYYEKSRAEKKRTGNFISRNKDLYLFLESNGFKNKSFEEPTKILNKMPKEHHYLFWRGFFDGDGCIYDQKTSKNSVSKRIELSGSFDYQWIEAGKLMDELQCKFAIKRTLGKYGSNSRLKIWRRCDVENFYKYLYKDNGKFGFLARKKNKFYLLKHGQPE